jgi:predicted DNA binding protein
VRLVRLAVVEGPDATEQVTFDLSALTPKQRRGLELAVVRGYFDDDRDVRLSELADELEISKSALSQRLRTAQAKLVTDVFDGAEAD